MKKNISVHLYGASHYISSADGKFDIYYQGIPSLLNINNSEVDWGDRILKCMESRLDVESAVMDVIENTTGLFSLIIVSEGECIIVSDIIRSFPLFWGNRDQNLFITDQLEKYQQEYDYFSIDKNKLEEYTISGLVFDNGTVYEKVYGIKPGEVVVYKEGEFSHKQYFNFSKNNNYPQYSSIDVYATKADEVLLSCFKRMLENFPNVRKWVVPLSGGHDSRLIVNYLHRLGVKNVLCFSYGQCNNNVQADISKEVAKTLGFEWYFVEYSEQKWKELHDDGLIDQYLEFAFNGVSTSHFQDLLAIYELKSRNVISSEDVVIPGHTSMSSRLWGKELNDLSYEKIRTDAYFEDLIVIHAQKHKDIYNYVEAFGKEESLEKDMFRAKFHWQEKHSKFIINSIRGYYFQGLRVALPLWDKELAILWLSPCSFELQGRKLLYEIEKLTLLTDSLKQVRFANDHGPKKVLTLRGVLKNMIPLSIIHLLVRFLGKNVKTSEGMNQLYALRFKTIKDLILPVKHVMPVKLLPYIKPYYNRSPYRMDPNMMTVLFTLTKLLNKNKL